MADSMARWSMRTAILRSLKRPLRSSLQASRSWVSFWLRMSTSWCRWVRCVRRVSEVEVRAFWSSVRSSEQAERKR